VPVLSVDSSNCREGKKAHCGFLCGALLLTMLDEGEADMVGMIIYVFLGLIELLLGLRFVFLLLGANPASAIVGWVYSWSGIFTAPFAGIFGQTATTAGPGVVSQSVFDWTTLIALIVYGLIGAILGNLFNRWWHPVGY
jgi:hypothetical protein